MSHNDSYCSSDEVWNLGWWSTECPEQCTGMQDDDCCRLLTTCSKQYLQFFFLLFFLSFSLQDWLSVCARVTIFVHKAIWWGARSCENNFSNETVSGGRHDYNDTGVNELCVNAWIDTLVLGGFLGHWKHCFDPFVTGLWNLPNHCFSNFWH